MFWDLLQQYQIGDAKRTAERATHAATRAHTAQEDVRGSIDKLTLACQAMWELLRERHDDLTDQMLLDKMREIDLRDGVVDGRITTGSVTCPSCDRMTSARTGKCQYCGAALPKGPTAFGGR